VKRHRATSLIHFNQRRAGHSSQRDDRMLFGFEPSLVDIGISNGRSGSVVNDDVRCFGGNLIGRHGKLIHPLWPAGEDLSSRKAQMRPIFVLGLFQGLLLKDNLNLFDVFAVQEKLDAA